ncbi:site-specific integrase [Sphingomonas sp. dw_22]|uniref:site-specific integrase n=1 Tax=Sphingomonas sp. dw_22 TaxID=2721175 RepID=UPI001BD58D07
MRPSEQIALYWSDVDWTHRTIRVRRARVRGELKGTKTAIERDVDLSDRMIAVLKRQRKHSERADPATPIFLNPETGKPWPDVQDQRKLYFHPALAALGIRKRDAKETRHTFATVALMGGVNPAYISRQLGHVDPRTVFIYYAKWIDGADHRREAEKLNRLFGNVRPSA